MQRSPAQFDSRPRAGFTMLELLIVMGIIALLVTILVIAIGPALGGAREAAVRATILRIDDVIKARVQAINSLDDAKLKSDAQRLVTMNAALTNVVTLQPLTLQQAMFLIKKELYRQALPQRIEDVAGFDRDIATIEDNAGYISGHGWVTAANSTDRNFNSALLHLALVEGSSVRALPGGTTYALPVLSEDNFNLNHHREVAFGADEAEAFYDEWDQPLRFFNFPTAMLAAAYPPSTNQGQVRALISGLPPAASAPTDASDPTLTMGALYDTAFQDAAMMPANLRHSLTPLFITLPFSTEFHPQGAYSVPVLMSAGPDQTLGFGEPTSGVPNERLGAVNAGEVDFINDNITNRQQ